MEPNDSDISLPPEESDEITTKTKSRTKKNEKSSSPSTTLKKKNTGTTTKIPEGKIVALPKQTGKKVGKGGLPPSTRIAVISSKNGGNIKYNTCTVAFSLAGKSGRPWAITAGHCGKPGQKVYALGKGGPMMNKSSYLGTIRATSKSNAKKHTSDWAAISLNKNALRPQSKGVPNSISTYPQKRGAKICKNGSSTGKTCGKIKDNDVLVAVADMEKKGKNDTAKMSSATLCAVQGDSGAPLYNDKGIVGVLISIISPPGGEDNKKNCGKTISFYTPVGEIVSQVSHKIPDIPDPL